MPDGLSRHGREALARLAQTDRALQAGAVSLLTLDPRRSRPSSVADVAARLVASEPDAGRVQRFAAALERIALSQLEHFPNNLFWDFDYLAATVWRNGQAVTGGYAALGDLFVELSALFGCRSPIRFRYVHDFAYGFDWERWVRRDPQRHAGIGPFDPHFLQHVLSRGREIIATIERGDDPTFPPLPAGVYRNPFPFSRAPEHEVRLFRALSQGGELAVSSWRIDAEPDWRVQASRVRLERASELGIPAL